MKYVPKLLIATCVKQANIFILLDGQAALKALQAYIFKSKTNSGLSTTKEGVRQKN